MKKPIQTEEQAEWEQSAPGLCLAPHMAGEGGLSTASHYDGDATIGAELMGRSDGSQPCAHCTPAQSHSCAAELTLALTPRPAPAAVEMQGEALVGCEPAVPLLQQGWLPVRASINK